MARLVARLFNNVASHCSRILDTSASCKLNYPVPKLWEVAAVGFRTKRLPWLENKQEPQVDVTNWDKEREQLASDVTAKINEKIANNSVGRLFAIVHVCGKQFKVTESDLVIIQGRWPPNPGDKLKLEKVLLVGGTDFTLIGRPILNRELVSVDATVINKTLSHTKTRFRMKRRKQYKRIKFMRIYHTMLRITGIKINGNIDEKKPFEGLDRIY